jgi:hypothetical protein
VATFTGLTGIAYTATINWGNGYVIAGTVQGSGTSYTITGSNLYGAAGAYPFSVQIFKAGVVMAVLSGIVTVSDAGLTAVGAPLSPTQGVAFANVPVARFIDPNLYDSLLSYGASIDWGDGSGSGAEGSTLDEGTIVPEKAGSYAVLGGHTYLLAGPFNITVTIGDTAGSNVTVINPVTVAPAAPAVTGLSPAWADPAGGTAVTITGNNLYGATGVSFGGTAATLVTANSDGSVTAVAPAGSGTVDVTVTTPAGTSPVNPADQFAYVAAPTVTGVSPSSGATGGGNTVTITGTNLAAVNQVLFGSSAAVFTVTAPTTISATAPYAAAGTVDVTVSSPYGASAVSSADKYTYTGTAPTVTGLDVTGGPSAGGTLVTVLGTNLNGPTHVSFGGTTTTAFTVLSGGELLVTVPARTAGTVDITVTTPYGTSGTSRADQFTLVAAPTVTGVSPASGPTGGGGNVTLTGSGFAGATQVLFGNTPAASFTVNSDTSLTVPVPPAAAGLVDVTVASVGGSSATGAADQYTFVATAPSVTAVSPNRGPTGGGTSVTITGANLNGATGVSFGSTPASSVTLVSPTQITATSPAGSAGMIDITVTTPYGTSATGAADQFTFADAAAPAVTGLSVPSGPMAGGTVVVLTGSGFTAATGVSFDTIAATSFTVNSDTQLTVTAPPSPGGTVDVIVTTPYGSSVASLADQFVYLGAVPVVTAVSATGLTTAGGISVTITGSGLTAANQVNFGNQQATVLTSNTDASITAMAPVQAPGTYDVTVATVYGLSATSGADQVAYTAAAGLPVVSGLSVTSGPTGGGTTTTISGSGFTGATAVAFGGIQASDFTVTSDTAITAVAPPAAAGPVDVTVATANGISATSSADVFTFTPAAPTVTAIAPASGAGAGGASVVITGTNFNGATGVSFGTTAAVFVVNSAISITATAPALAAGTYHVTVTTPNGTSATSPADQYTAVNAAVPAVVYISVTSGPAAGGTSVVVTGVGFTGATAVNFGAVAAASFTVNSDTQITVPSPPQPAGPVDITVTTLAGTSAVVAADQFTYTQAVPTVTGVSPSTDTTAGGSKVSVSGTNFTGAAAVFFGTTPATSFVVASDTAITAIDPPAAAGVVDITVQTAQGTSAISSADKFTYTAATKIPSVTGLNPTGGPTAGGTSVTITGTNLLGATAVLFAGAAAPSFTVISATSITATAPAGASGPAFVQVAAAAGTSATGSGSTFIYQSRPPSLTGVSPTSDTTAGGTVISLTGSVFTGATAVSFGSIPGVTGANLSPSFKVNSDTSISAIDPVAQAGSTSMNVVMVNGPGGWSPALPFPRTGTANTPAVTGVSPSSGVVGGGTQVTITGTTLAGATGVWFGSVPAAFTVNSPTSVTATAPAQAAGTVDVLVATAYGYSSQGNADRFTYVGAAPTVTAVSPPTGPAVGGTPVTITGTNLNVATSVHFGTVSATPFTAVSGTQITVNAPAGSAGTVHVTVTSPYGTSTTSSADQFTYVALPNVTSLSVNTGPATGGTSVVITGTNFTGLVAVSFGSIPAASITVNSSTQLTVTSPAGQPGVVDVIVTTANGTSASSTADEFTYTAAGPAVTGVSPPVGPTAGGTSVTITGSGFTGATQVWLDGVAAAAFTFNSDTSINATTPAAASLNTVDVTVTTATGGTSAPGTGDQFTFLADPVRNLAGFLANTLAGNVNGSTGAVAIGFTVDFYGNNYTSLYVNNNGSVTFDGPLATATPFPLTTTTHPILAPFFANVDTRVGQVVTYGTDTVNGKAAFGVNWINVGYYSEHVDKTNVFQLVIIDRADIAPGDFDVEFNFGRVSWETGDASGGSDGLGGQSARVGFSNGSGTSGTYTELAGSGVGGAFLDGNPVTSLINGSLNSTVLGRYSFSIRN